MGRRERYLMRETNNRLREIEEELKDMQKQWIKMYEEVIRMINDNKASDYIEDQKHDND